jgi:hypothetical protein
MAFTALLEFGDNNIKRYSKSYMVADCQFVFERPCNQYAPDGAAKCERIELEVIAPGREDLGLYEWYSAQSVQNGRLTIDINNGGASDTDVQTLYFEEARCFRLSEYYDISTSRRRMIKLSICADVINVEDVEFKPM